LIQIDNHTISNNKINQKFNYPQLQLGVIGANFSWGNWLKLQLGVIGANFSWGNWLKLTGERGTLYQNSIFTFFSNSFS